MAAPTAEDAETYLAEQGGSWGETAIASAFAAEKRAQARRCRVPADDAEWDEDLVEALFRRTAHNLGLRALPLGVQANITDGAIATSRVGGLDAEVRRLEGPFRKLVKG